MPREEAIDILKANYPDSCYELLREAVDTAIEALKQPERKKGKWIIKKMNTYELSCGTTAYEPVYMCSVCERLTESYLRLDEPIMPEDADFPRFCPWCGAELEVPKDV